MQLKRSYRRSMRSEERKFFILALDSFLNMKYFHSTQSLPVVFGHNNNNNNNDNDTNLLLFLGTV